MERFVEKMQIRLRAIKPDIAIISWTTNAGRFGHMKELPRSMPTRMNLLFDAPVQEYWLDETNRGMSIVPAFAAAYIWTVSNHRQAFCEPYLMSHGNPYGTDAFPPLETMFRAMQVITQGSQLGLAMTYNRRVRPEAPGATPRGSSTAARARRSKSDIWRTSSARSAPGWRSTCRWR